MLFGCRGLYLFCRALRVYEYYIVMFIMFEALPVRTSTSLCICFRLHAFFGVASASTVAVQISSYRPACDWPTKSTNYGWSLWTIYTHSVYICVHCNACIRILSEACLLVNEFEYVWMYSNVTKWIILFYNDYKMCCNVCAHIGQLPSRVHHIPPSPESGHPPLLATPRLLRGSARAPAGLRSGGHFAINLSSLNVSV